MKNKTSRILILTLSLLLLAAVISSCNNTPQTTEPPKTAPDTIITPPSKTPEVSYLENGLEYVIDSDISCHITGIGTFDGTVLEIPREDAEGRLISYIDLSAFKENTSITEIIIAEGVSEVRGSAFRDCSSVKKITLPESIDTIGSFALYGLSSLEEITFPASLTKLGEGNLINCTSLKNIRVAQGNKKYKSDGGILYNADMTTLISYPVARTDTDFKVPEGVKVIGNASFLGCKYIKTVTLSSTVENIADHAFRDCTALETLTLGEAFIRIGVGSCYNCTSLKTVNFPGTKETWDDDEKMVIANTWDKGAGKYTINYEYKG